PSRLMMPLSFAGLISGMMTLVATPPNLVVNSELLREGLHGFNSMIATTWITKFWNKIKMFRYTQIITFILSALMYFSVGRENLIL
ncbi:hypothetical protein MJI69_29600, partial [Salmonella enterica subsp. enterica serovar Anatum]|nr:hypothetical protein [Salmonella enterica subsp. enterica serovar Anatum]